MRICMRIMYSIYPVSSPVTPMTMIGTITILGATKDNQTWQEYWRPVLKINTKLRNDNYYK